MNRGSNPFSHGNGAQPHKPAVLQPRVTTASQMKQPPAAPPVYRPQPVPKVLQAKNAVSQQPRAASTPRQPIAPPVYRPQPTPQVLQQKTRISPPHMNVAPSIPAPHARPQIGPAAVQPKMASPQASAPSIYTGRAAVGVVQLGKKKKKDKGRDLKKQPRKTGGEGVKKPKEVKFSKEKLENYLSEKAGRPVEVAKVELVDKKGKHSRAKVVRKPPANYAYSQRRGGSYGQKNKLTVGELMSTSAGGQTTYLEAKINGQFIGKFSNADFHMGNQGWDALSGNRTHYPTANVEVAPWDDATKTDTGVCKGHAEDYLLVALNVIHKATGGNWASRYPRAAAQTTDLLSIRISKSPCTSCARNLIKACTAFGLKLRIKAALGHMDDPRTLSTGVSLLDTANVPVRFWKADQFTTSRSNRGLRKEDATTLKATVGKPPYKEESREQKEATHQGLFDAARPTHRGADVGWGAANLSRKRGQI